MATGSSHQKEGDIDHGSRDHQEFESYFGDLMHDVPIIAEASAASPDTPTGDHSTGALFFADATLDLSEAHDMAETPVPRRFLMEAALQQSRGSLMEMPNLAASRGNLQREISSEHSASAAVATSSDHKTTSSVSTTQTSNLQRISNDAAGPRPAYPPRRPRRPRDIPWAVSFAIIVPMSLFWTMSRHRDYSFYTQSAQLAVFNSILLSYGATFVLARILYRTMGGGDGDDARHVATHVVSIFAPISVGVYLLLTLVIYLKTPDARAYAFIPVAFLVRHLWALRHWRHRQTFFEALMAMALDILSRSLRRSSFYRMVTVLMGVQLLFVVIWKLAVFGALGQGTFWVFLALFAGKWLTATMARVLGLIASGGIASWFAQQSVLMEEMERTRALEQNEVEQDIGDTTPGDDASVDFNVGYTSRVLPEEYRTADASVYQSVLDMDEGIDDDYEDEDDGLRHSNDWINTGGSTVKTFCITALTTSFGSVAECGMLGGLAQFTWSVVRNVDATTSSFSEQSVGFCGMQIGQDARGVNVILKVVHKASRIARSFVRTHSDLGMSHVAVYYKNYQRAASDVMALVETTGVEPIINDDMTTHMCSSICGSVSGFNVVLIGLVLSYRRSGLSDEAIVHTMLLAFLFCYTLLFALMEPLRASIKAIYVSFGERPQSLSQAFPLIFHRLSRISDDNVV